jgi:hypothetical protein
METTAFQGKPHIKCKEFVEKIEKIQLLIFWGFNVSHYLKEDISIKLSTFQRMCRTIREMLRHKPDKVDN